MEVFIPSHVSANFNRRSLGWRDIPLIWHISRRLIRSSPDVLVTTTSKIGALGQVLRFFSVKARGVHIFTGQVWSPSKVRDFPFRFVDTLIFLLVDKAFFDSIDQYDACRKLFPFSAAAQKLWCWGLGSLPTPNSIDCLGQLQMSSQAATLEVMYCGRITQDKRVRLLIESFLLSLEKGTLPPRTRLRLFGSFDYVDSQGFQACISKLIAENSEVVVLEPFVVSGKQYESASVFVSMSAREGFAVSCIEAGLLGIPSVVFDTTGFKSAVFDGVTGYRVKDGDCKEFWSLVGILLRDRHRRCALGVSAGDYAKNHFNPAEVAKAVAISIASV